MKIAGIQKLTLLDYPGHIAATVFLPGCNMRCDYCHNKELVIPSCIEKIKDSFISEETFFNFLEKRKGLIEGVCITGGEPTIHIALPRFINQIKSAGFKVKLDTNGTNFKMVKELIDSNLIDYIAMDIKASKDNYLKLTHLTVPYENVAKTKDLIINSQMPHEFRTTVIKGQHDPQEFDQIIRSIAGAQNYYIQNFRSKSGCINPNFEKLNGMNSEELKQMQEKATDYVTSCAVRN